MFAKEQVLMLRSLKQHMPDFSIDTHLCDRQTMQHVRAQVLRLRSLKPYTPDFKTAFEHFCIHPGGKTVIQGVGSQVLSPSPMF